MEPKAEILKLALEKWSEEDYAQWAFAVSLGIVRPELEWRDVRHVFETNHPVALLMLNFLNQLVREGILEKQEGEGLDEYRWNKAYKGSWEDRNKI